MLALIVVEDNPQLRLAVGQGIEATGKAKVVFHCASGEEVLEYCLQIAEVQAAAAPADVVLLDVQLAGQLDGIATAVELRREFPRLPVVFYSIQDDDAYFRAFRQAGILSHYAYVRKSNFLLPEMILPLLADAVAGRGFVDPEIERRVHEVRQKDEQDPMSLLEPNEQRVARLLAQGMTNEQIAAQMGFRDKRTISRVNGQIYAVWGLKNTATDEKIARTRAAMIVRAGRLIAWSESGQPGFVDENGTWAALSGDL